MPNLSFRPNRTENLRRRQKPVGSAVKGATADLLVELLLSLSLDVSDSLRCTLKWLKDNFCNPNGDSVCFNDSLPKKSECSTKRSFDSTIQRLDSKLGLKIRFKD